jgi:hypothetical protein
MPASIISSISSNTTLSVAPYLFLSCFEFQETGFAHMRICDGVGSYLQLCGLLAKLAVVRETAKAA